MIFLLVALITFIIGVITYYYWQNSYWQRRNIPEVEGKRFFTGHFYQFFNDANSLSFQMRDWTKKYGKYYGIYQGMNKYLITSDLTIVNEVFTKQFENFHGREVTPFAGDPESAPVIHLFFAQGARWKRLRSISSNAFTTANLKKIHEIVEDSAIEMTKLLEEKTNSEIDIKLYLNEYTMDTISRIAIGQTTSTMFHNPLLEMAQKCFNGDFTNPIAMAAYVVPVINPLIRTIFMTMGKYFKNDAVTPFLEIVDKIGIAVNARIKQRKEDENRGIEKGEPSDFIDMYLDAKSDDLVVDSSEYSHANISISKTLSEEEIKAQLMLFIIAGYDTTANTLSLVSFLLARHPDKLKIMQEEIDRECNAATISHDTLPKLKYMDAFIKETLRVYPLATNANSRLCMRTTNVGGLIVKQGEYVLADVWTLHHDKTLWGEDADEFKPERWLDGTPHPPGAYLSFGAGPRICIGMRLAYMEAKLALCHILRKFDIVEGPNTGKELKMHGSQLVHADHVNVIIRPRN